MINKIAEKTIKPAIEQIEKHAGKILVTAIAVILSAIGLEKWGEKRGVKKNHDRIFNEGGDAREVCMNKKYRKKLKTLITPDEIKLIAYSLAVHICQLSKTNISSVDEAIRAYCGIAPEDSPANNLAINEKIKEINDNKYSDKEILEIVKKRFKSSENIDADKQYLQGVWGIFKGGITTTNDEVKIFCDKFNELQKQYDTIS